MSELAPVVQLFNDTSPLERVCDETTDELLREFDIKWVETSDEPVIHRFRGGVMLDREHTLSDGSHYKSREVVPKQHRYDIPVTRRPSWCTGIDGLVTEDAKSLAQTGIPSLLLEERPGLFKSISKVVKTALGDTALMAHDSEVQHVILDDLIGETQFESDIIIDSGYSHGAMSGFGVLGYAPRHDRNVAYGEYIDPCVEHAVTRDEVDAKDLAIYFGVEEPRELFRVIMQHRLSQLGNLARTAPLTVPFWVNQVAKGFSIFDGEAGTFVDHIPEDSKAYIRLFTGSNFNQAVSWERRLRKYSGIYIEKTPGCHMTGADPDIRDDSIKRIINVQDELAYSGGSSEHLDVEAIVASMRTAA